MSRGRTPRTAATLRRATDFFKSPVVEALEHRDYLTTLQGGDVFNYLDANDNVVRIRLIGNIQAEFIAARVRGTDNSVVIRDLVPAPPPNSQLQPDGADLFQIYVAAASPDAQILISSVPNVNSPDNAATTFDDSITLRPTVPNTDNTVTATNGGVYIGARTVQVNGAPPNTGDIPIFFNPRRQALGIRPAGKPLFAGIQTAPGVSLGKVYIAGTITGIVNIEGNVGTFYAGNILTGDATSLTGGARTTSTNNFSIGGDLRTLLVLGSIGTVDGGGDYRTGFDARIGGKLGYVHVIGNQTGSFEVINSPSIQGFTTPIAETESAAGLFFAGFINQPAFKNDSPGEGTPAINVGAQFGSAFTSARTGVAESLEFTGTLEGATPGDLTDTYSLPLLAGQTVTLQLNSLQLAQLGVLDPLGRLVATDIPDADGDGANLPFRLTAKVPGVYRLVVAERSDNTFNGSVALNGAVIYSLTARQVGNLAFGGADVGGATTLAEPGIGLAIRTGDFGGWETTGTFQAAIGSPIAVSRGSIRAISGGAIAGANGANAPTLVAPRGSVGYLLSNGLLSINSLGAVAIGGLPISQIGGDYQRVEARGDLLAANISANGNIGTIIGATITGGTFAANVDGAGGRGQIDTIYCAGNMTAPTLSTGPAGGLVGNIKYVFVGGTLLRGGGFGGSFSTQIVGLAGQSLTFTDDSGARAIITPSTSVTGAVATPGVLTVQYLPVLSGGGVVVSVASTTSANITTLNNRGSFDVTQLTTATAGSAVSYNALLNTVGFTGTGGAVAAPSPVAAVTSEVILRGAAPINLFNLTGSSLTNVNNTTSGEIASINATSVGYLAAQSIGIRSTTGSEVNLPTNLSLTVFPYNPFSRGVDVTSSMIAANIRDGIENLHVANAIGTVNPNADGTNARGGVFDGIHGAVVARVLQNVNIGEGIADAGTGSVVGGGVFAVGTDARLQNVRGNNADVRGYLVATGQIGSVALNNGSLIGARVLSISDLAQSPFTASQVFTLPDDLQQTTGTDTGGGTTSGAAGGTVIGIGLPAFGINFIRTTGTGGILGSLIAAADINVIDAQGFGIVNSTIRTTTQTTANNIIEAGGLGIRNSFIDAGASINRVSAVGQGQVLNVNSYSGTVRQSIRSHFNTLGNGRLLSASNDLNRALGTSRGRPKISGITNAGLIVDTNILGNGNLNELTAYLIGSPNRVTSPLSPAFPMRVAFANQINSVGAAYVSGLSLSTGVLGSFTVKNILQQAAIITSGRMGTISAGRSILGSTQITSGGPQGTIDSIFARRGLFGTITATGNIGVVNAGSLGATLNTSTNIQSILVRGDILSTADIRARKRLNSLVVAGDVQTGAKIAAQTYGTITISGANHGTFTTL